MAIIMKLLVQALPFLGRFGWFIGFLAINRYGRRVWRWFWA